MQDETYNRMRPTVVEISRAAVLENFAVTKKCAPVGAGVLAMVKADAYGHGAIMASQWLAHAGVDALGVATIEEGIELRTAGLSVPIVVMGGLMGQGSAAAKAALEFSLTCVVHSVAGVRSLVEAVRARKDATPTAVHLKIDTGMSRLGVRTEGLHSILNAISAAPEIQLAGVMTHYAHSVDVEPMQAQIAQFVAAAATIRTKFSSPLIWHAGKSASIIHDGAVKNILSVPLTQPSPQREREVDTPQTAAGIIHPWCAPIPLGAGDRVWVRPGIMLYGIAPCDEQRGVVPLVPAMRVKTQIALTKKIPAGTAVSYGGRWIAPRDSRIAVLPLGYADGYPWALGNRGSALVCGRRVPIVGSVTMDMILCDITGVDGVQVGDDVVVLGEQNGAWIHAEDLAAACDTIPYEITCRVSKRMPRVAT